MALPVRRVVTGHDEDGKAIVVADDDATMILERPSRPGVALTNLWQTPKVPAEMNGPEEALEGEFVLHPPKGGTIFRIVEFWPEDPEQLARIDGKEAFAAMGASHNVVEGARHPYMHRTDSVDYAVVIEGEIDMLLDDCEVHLKAGDTVVQRGTNHAWSNRSDAVCRIAFILVDAE